MSPTVHWTDTDKEKISRIALDLGADQVSFLSLQDYVSPCVTRPKAVFTGAKIFRDRGFSRITGSVYEPEHHANGGVWRDGYHVGGRRIPPW